MLINIFKYLGTELGILIYEFQY